MGNEKTFIKLKEIGKKKKKELSPFSPYGMLELEEYINDTPKKIYEDEIYELTGYENSDRHWFIKGE